MKKHYYLFSSGTLRRKDHSLFMESGTEEEEQHDPDRGYVQDVDTALAASAQRGVYIPIQSVESLYCFGEMQFSSNVLRFLGSSEIPMHIFDYYGNYTSTLYPRDGAVSGILILEQARARLNADRRLAIAREIVSASLTNADRTLAYYEHRGVHVAPERMRIAEMIEDAEAATGLKRLMGCEGYGRRNYYEAWPLLIAPEPFAGRSTRPPGDPANAALSFSHALLYAVVTSECYRAGLHPSISYLHEPADRRFSLSLDIADVFKSIIADRMVLTMFHTSVLRSAEHFERRNGGSYLNEAGRKTVVRCFDEKLRSTFEHRQLRRSISYRQLIQWECMRLVAALKEGGAFTAFRSWW